MSTLNVEDLANSIDSIVLEDTEMAQYQLLKLNVDTIPHYDGNPHTLGIFIDSCESLINNFQDRTNTQLNTYLLRAIIGKLTGRALTLVGSRIELRSWASIKDTLQLCFGDQRNLDCLIQDLITLCPHRNEAPYNFGMRCQDARSLIVSKVNSLSFSPEEKIIRLKSYDDLALKTFIRGLTGYLQNNIRLRNPDSLEKAMSLVVEEENFLYSQNRNNSLNLQNNFRPSQRVVPSMNQKPKNLQIRPQANSNYQYSQFQNQPNFNNSSRSNTMNTFNPRNNGRPQFQSSPMSNFQNRFPSSNSQNNLRPPLQNNFQFRPHYSQNVQQNSPLNQNKYAQNNSTISKRSFKPEPMDTSSSNSPIRPQNRFISTELYNQVGEELENPFDQLDTDREYEQYSNDRNDPNQNYSSQNDQYMNPTNFSHLNSYPEPNNIYDENMSNSSTNGNFRMAPSHPNPP